MTLDLGDGSGIHAARVQGVPESMNAVLLAGTVCGRVQLTDVAVMLDSARPVTCAACAARVAWRALSAEERRRVIRGLDASGMAGGLMGNAHAHALSIAAALLEEMAK